jgi:hypothetical protein
VGVVEFEEWPHSGVPVRIKIDLTTSNSKAHERQRIVTERIKKGMRRTKEKERSRRKVYTKWGTDYRRSRWRFTLVRHRP